MMKMILTLTIMLISISMFFLNNPLSMGLMILIQTLLTCMLTGMMIKTYWFSYILFLTFLGGLLVLFIYVSSIASNELFNLTIKMKIFMSMSFMLILMFSMMNMNNLMWLNFFNSLEMNNFFNIYNIFNIENKINLNKLYNSQTFLLMMMMVIYLFITLIAVVKITNIFYGPIRTSN